MDVYGVHQQLIDDYRTSVVDVRDPRIKHHAAEECARIFRAKRDGTTQAAAPSCCISTSGKPPTRRAALRDRLNAWPNSDDTLAASRAELDAAMFTSTASSATTPTVSWRPSRP